jgi:CRISPR-associated protein Cas1
MPLERLQHALEKALRGDYRPPPLFGLVLETARGNLRPLAVPPFFDRVLQRAVAQILSPALESSQYRHSYGYRAGRSRMNARDAVQAASRQGYQWVYESDIDDFFDSVDRGRLEVRLRALYGEDPLVELLLAWMGQPVEYQGQAIARKAGLPQGSPLSPAMANLMLDDFDSDMEVLGFKLIRFADDFVVLCKSREQAESARRAAAASLAEHGLNLNVGKTRIAEIGDGFRYLGYLFVNDLAVDVSGHNDEIAGKTNVPPNSWLARLGGRTPLPVEAVETSANVPSPHGGGLGWGQAKSVASLPSNRPSPNLLPLGGGVNSTALHPDPLPEEDAANPAKIGAMNDMGQLLCVVGGHATLSTHAGRLRVERDGQTQHDVAWNNLQAVVLFGSHTLTTPALLAALARKVPVHFAGSTGGYRGVLWTGQPAEPGTGLWLKQANLFADPALCLHLAKEIVDARIRHLRETLRRHGETEAAEQLKRLLASVANATGLDELNGVEGSSTRQFFQALQGLLPADWHFTGRNRQPPLDPFNALLSYGYTLLHGYVETLLHTDGLLPWLGFYHQAHGRHATLASDLMEPFRHLVERTALSCVQRKELKAQDFFTAANGACLMQQQARRDYLASLFKRLNEPLLATGEETPATPVQHIHRQNLSLAGWLMRGEDFHAWRTR